MSCLHLHYPLLLLLLLVSPPQLIRNNPDPPHSLACSLAPPLSSQVLGQVGKVLKVYGDGDLRVAFGGQTWTFNPACLSAQPVEVDANLMTAENPNESGSKASRQGPPACSRSCLRPAAANVASAERRLRF